MRITKETQALFGTDRDVQCYELLNGETKLIPYQFFYGNTPVDISNYTFGFELIERQAESVTDTKSGINIYGLEPKPGANVIVLNDQVTVTNAIDGNVQVYIPNSVTSLEPSNPDAEMPIIYTGFFSINNGSPVDPEVQKIQFLVLVSNDGV